MDRTLQNFAFALSLPRKTESSDSPAATIAMPKGERKSRGFLRVDEYMKLLNAAAGHSRDYAILQLFLQTGIGVAELAGLTLSDIDLDAQTMMMMNGKGNKQRTIYVEKKATTALRAYIADRPKSLDQHLYSTETTKDAG